MIYLDNAGTTKMFDECVDVHRLFSCEKFYNPSAITSESGELSSLIGEVQEYIIKKLGAKGGNIIFTGCATESNNLAIKGSLRSGNWEYVFSEGEHPSVYNVAKKLALDGHIVHFVPLGKNGEVDYDELSKVLNSKTRLLSIMHVSNETGAINDLERISLLKEKLCPNAIFHVDGVQGFMKIPTSLRKTAVDLYSFSGHKIHAPKGIAGLYVKKKESLKCLFEGGGQQYGVRSGTENVSGIMQLKRAIELIDVNKNFEHVKLLKNNFIDSMSFEKGIVIKDFCGSPYILNVVFSGVKGETMLHALNQKGVIIGLGSACSAKKAGNRVLESLGEKSDEIISSARISFNAYQSEEEVKNAAEIIVETYREIKEKVG